MSGFLTAVAVTAVVAFAVGAAVGRWFSVGLAALAWPVWAVGIWVGAWGYGFGQETEGWVIVIAVDLLATAAAVSAAVGVLARRRHSGLARPLLPNVLRFVGVAGAIVMTPIVVFGIWLLATPDYDGGRHAVGVMIVGAAGSSARSSAPSTWSCVRDLARSCRSTNARAFNQGQGPSVREYS